MEPLNKGHFGDSTNSLVLSFVGKLSSSQRLLMYKNHRKSKYLGPRVVSFVERFIIHCHYRKGSTIGGSTVYSESWWQ